MHWNTVNLFRGVRTTRAYEIGTETTKRVFVSGKRVLSLLFEAARFYLALLGRFSRLLKRLFYRAEARCASLEQAIRNQFAMSEAVMESVWRYLGITIQGIKIRGKDRVPYIMIDTNTLKDPENKMVNTVVRALHDNEIPFKVISEGRMISPDMEAHIRWFMNKTDGAQPLLDEYLPGRMLDFEDWRRWYLESAKVLMTATRHFNNYLCIPAYALEIPKLEFLKDIVCGYSEISDYFLRLWGDESSSELATLWNRDDSPDKSRTDFISANRIDIDKKMGVRTIWHGHAINRFEQIRPYAFSLKHAFEGRSPSVLLSMLQPYIETDQSVYVATDVYPVADKRKRQLTNMIRSRIRSQRNKSAKKHAVNNALKNHWEAMSETNQLIDEYDRMAFGYISTIHLKTTSDNPEDIDDGKKQLREEFRDREIHHNYPETIIERQEWFRSLLPVVDQPFDHDTIQPETDWFVKDLMISTRVPTPKNGILVGSFASGFPFILGGRLKVVLLTGGLGSGKSTVAKEAAFNFLYMQPQGKVIVVDNSKNSEVLDQHYVEESLKGWIDICRVFGGETIFSGDYKKPGELKAKLKSLADVRFLLYYPNGEFKGNDLEFMDWEVGEFNRLAKPKEHTEADVQMMAVFDDMLSWYENSGDPRGSRLTNNVLTTVKTNGVLAFVSVQTPQAITSANQTAHDTLVQITDISINFEGAGYDYMAEALGVIGSTPESRQLADSISKSLMSLSRRGLLNPDGPRPCTVVFKNVVAEDAEIFVHPELRRIIDRMSS